MTRPLVITDHAVLRYLERTGLVDIEAVRQKIATMVARGLVAGASLGPGEFHVVVGGSRFVIEDGRVVTTLTPQMHTRRGRKRRRP